MQIPNALQTIQSILVLMEISEKWLQPVQEGTLEETVMHACVMHALNGAAHSAHSELPYLKQEVKKSTTYRTVFHSW